MPREVLSRRSIPQKGAPTSKKKREKVDAARKGIKE